MNRRTLFAAAAAGALLQTIGRADAGVVTPKGSTMPTPRPKSGYAPVNGIEVYYEIYGEGAPLVLLHGGLGAIEMFGPVLSELATGRQVIGIDLQGHGRTLPFDRPMTFEAMATDVAELIGWLGCGKVDVMGYSLGGLTALRLAIDHPEVVGKLVLTSTPYAFAGWHDYNQQGMKSVGTAPEPAAEELKQTPMYQAYLRLMPDAETNWIRTVTQTGKLTGSDFDWADEVKSVRSPTLLVVGDWDAVRIGHATLFFELLGGGKQDGGWDGSGMNANRFAVIQGTTHYTIYTDPRLAGVATQFLDS